MSLSGYVDFFDRHTGFAQIVGADARVYRVHRAEFIGMTELRTGEAVEFDAIETPRGPRAAAVRVPRGEARPAKVASADAGTPSKDDIERRRASERRS